MSAWKGGRWKRIGTGGAVSTHEDRYADAVSMIYAETWTAVEPAPPPTQTADGDLRIVTACYPGRSTFG